MLTIDRPNLEPTQMMRLYMGQSLFGFGFRRKSMYYSSWRTKIQDVGVLHFRRPFIDLTSSHLLLWRLASTGLQDYPGLLYLRPREDYRSDSDNNTARMHHRFLTEFCIDRVTNTPSGSFPSPEKDPRPILHTFLVAGLCYGMLHLSAWHAYFHSNVEATLWRISGITLTVFGFVPWPYVWGLGHSYHSFVIPRAAKILSIF
jgi:hypothetical protein